MVANIAGSNSEIVESNTLMVGPAYTLPFHEHFGKNTDYGWIIIGNTEDDAIGWVPEEATMGKDGLPGVSSYFGEMDLDKQQLASGKIYIPEGSDATLGMWLMGRTNTSGNFRILLSETFAEGYKTIFKKKFDSTTDSSWHPIEVSLKYYAGKNIYLALEGCPEDGGIIIGIDNLTIRERVDYDAAVTNITIDTDEVSVGRKSATVKTWITNQGIKTMTEGSYSVDFFAGDRMFASIPGVNVDALFGYADFTAEYAPTVDDADPSTIYSRISFDKDMDKTNNESKGLSVYVVRPELPSATSL